MSIDTELLNGSLNIINLFKIVKYRVDFGKNHPNYFIPEGLLIFCGSQGSGKTLSAVQYSSKCLDKYEKCVFCTNVEIKEFPINCYYSRYSIIENNIEKNIVEFYTILGEQMVRRVMSWYDDGEQHSTILVLMEE